MQSQEILSPLILIDKLATENAHNCTHFLTRPLTFAQPPPSGATIYTTAFVRTLLRRSKPDVPADVRIVALEPLQRHRLRLSDGGELFVVLLPTESAELNVMLLMELNGRRILYTGAFTECASVLRTNWLQIQDRPIHTAYVDNASVAGSPSATAARCYTLAEACAAVARIAERHPDHRLRIPLPNVGAEDLLWRLSRPPYSYRITVGPARMLLLRHHYAQQLRQHHADDRDARDDSVERRLAAMHSSTGGRDTPALPRPPKQLENFTDEKQRARIVAVVTEPATTAEQYAVYVRAKIVTVRLVPVPVAMPTEPRYCEAFGMYDVPYHVGHASARQVLELLEQLPGPTRVRGLYARTKRETDGGAGGSGAGDERRPSAALSADAKAAADLSRLLCEGDGDDEAYDERAACLSDSARERRAYEKRDRQLLKAVFGGDYVSDSDDESEEEEEEKEEEEDDDAAAANASQHDAAASQSQSTTLSRSAAASRAVRRVDPASQRQLARVPPNNSRTGCVAAMDAAANLSSSLCTTGTGTSSANDSSWLREPSANNDDTLASSAGARALGNHSMLMRRRRRPDQGMDNKVVPAKRPRVVYEQTHCDSK